MKWKAKKMSQDNFGKKIKVGLFMLLCEIHSKHDIVWRADLDVERMGLIIKNKYIDFYVLFIEK